MNTRRAFTLVEILVVVVIISILAALVTVAVAGAMRAAKRAAIATEMSQIAMALERYKAEFGEYPPDMFDDAVLVRHVKKRWPRLDWTKTETLLRQASVPFPGESGSWDTRNWNNMPMLEREAWLIKRSIGFTYGCDVGFLRAPHPHASIGALALWLGGFPNSDGHFSGFFADPECPFISNGPPVYDNMVFYDMQLGNNARFVRTGLPDRIGGPYPPGSGGGGGGTPRDFVPLIGVEINGHFLPFHYFRGKTGGGHDAYLFGAAPGQVKQGYLGLETHEEISWSVPYAESTTIVEGNTVIKWKNPTTYQLIHPGLDGKFSVIRPRTDGAYPPVESLRVINTGAGLLQEDLDNITNISDLKELRSILP